MNIKINITEVAIDLAYRDLITAFGDVGGKNRFTIVRDVEGEDDITEYTEEAQDFFNQRYDYWWDYLYDQKVGDEE